MQTPSFSIYDASAGSGKTYTLVKEYLKIILIAQKNDAYRNILAITFTNKAVHEMKSRVVENLSEFAKENPSPKAEALMLDLARETLLSVIQIKNKSKQIIKHIIHNYAAFDISTIDKFTHRVIRTFAYDLQLPITFEVTLDTENLLAEAVDAIISKAGDDKTLTQLLIDFTMEKTDDDKSWDISNEILETGKLVLNENSRNEIALFQHKSITDFIEIKKKLKTKSLELEHENAQKATNVLQSIINIGIDLKSFSGNYFPKHLQSIQEKKFNPKNKTYHEVEDIKINKSAKDKEIIEKNISQWLNALFDIYENFKKIAFYNAFLQNITPLSLLNELNLELDTIQKEQNILSISEFNAIVHREIQNQPAPFIYERLGERYRHFFIDEFQDTSEMQWQNLIPLIDNALSGQDDFEKKGTLLLVGDPKQSIYRWRGGKAEQFIALTKTENPFSNKDKKVFHLNTNYRSYSEIINFNNSFFKQLAQEFEQPDYKDLYENHSHQNENHKKGGYVTIKFLDLKEELLEIDKINLFTTETLNRITESIKKGFQYNDIAIITRKKSQGIAVASKLMEEGIPIISSETLQIQNSTEVLFLIHFLRYLKNDTDLEAKAHFLYYIGQNIQETLPLADFITQGMEQKKESDFEKWLTNFNINLSFLNIRKKALYEIVQIATLKWLAQKNNNNAYIQYFLDVVFERDIKNQTGISEFLDFWKKNSSKFSIPSPEGSNAVKIMTIHKSKGLEFPVVIFPFANEDYSHKPKDKLWLNAENDFNMPKALINNTSAVENFSKEAKSIYNQKKQEELLDNINVLYVALTRAEEQLHIISSIELTSKDKMKSSTMSSYFVNYLINKGIFDFKKNIYNFGKENKCSTNIKTLFIPEKITSVLEVLNSKNIKIAQRESIMWGTQQQEAIEYGNLIHEILSYIKTKNDINKAIQKASENGLFTQNQKKEILKTIQDIVNHPKLKSYFEIENVVLNEQIILQKNQKTIKPDRIVLNKNNEILLLDYKTGKYQNAHKSQIDDYQNIIEKTGHKITKKSLVYIAKEIEILEI